MKSHFGTLVNCASLESQSSQCCELFSVFGSQSSHALLLLRRTLTKSISSDSSIFSAYVRARSNGAHSLEFQWRSTKLGHYPEKAISGI